MSKSTCLWPSTSSFSWSSAIESQDRHSIVEKEGTIGQETFSLAAASRIALVALYFVLNMTLTFYTKSLLNDFPFPYLMSGMHAACAVIGCALLRALADKRTTESCEKSTKLLDSGPVSIPSNHGMSLVVVLYSTLYAANIAISNASLRLVSVPFHQIIRSTCPMFTLALGLVLLSQKPQPMAVCALVPIIGGAIMSCLGELSFTSYGFISTVLGTVLAAVKTVVTHLLQVGGAGRKARKSRWSVLDTASFQMTPLQLLQVMSPLACVLCLFTSFMSGELESATQVLSTLRCSHLLVLIGNGVLAFALNVVSFQTNKVAGPLTMTVVGNAKQVTTILLAVHFYRVQLGQINIVGVSIALSGTAWYGVVELRRRG